MGNIVIVGSSGHARVVIDIVEEEGQHRIVGLLDRYRDPGEKAGGYRIIGQEDDLPRLMASGAVDGALIAIGDNFVRHRVAQSVLDQCPGLPLVTAVHPDATVAKSVSLGEGTVVMAGATINPGCHVGRCCILNSNSSLDHDSFMGDFSSLAPCAVTGGNVRVGAFSAVSIGATVIHGVEIGDHTVIGAGAVVLGDVEANTVAYGTPARAIRTRNPGEKYL